MLICIVQLSDIPSHYFSQMWKPCHSMHLSHLINASPGKLNFSVGIWGVQNVSSLSVIIPGTCKDDSEREKL